MSRCISFDPNPERHIGYKEAIEVHKYGGDKDRSKGVISTNKNNLWQAETLPRLGLGSFKAFLEARELEWGSLAKTL
eukprot:12914931-Prorocentrum_lima.AAC.1